MDIKKEKEDLAFMRKRQQDVYKKGGFDTLNYAARLDSLMTMNRYVSREEFSAMYHDPGPNGLNVPGENVEFEDFSDDIETEENDESEE